MSYFLEPKLAPKLARLERFWLWKRRHLVHEIHEHICASDAHMLQLATHGKALQAALEKISNEHQQLQSDHSSIMQELVKRDTEFRHLSEKHDSQLALLISQKEAFQQLQVTHQNLAEENFSLHAEHRDLTGAYELVQDRYDLVCAILNCQPADNPSLQQLQNWLTGDFVQNVQRLELPGKATTHALEQAHAIAQHVELLADAPALHDKFLVAVAGGFSSGKSSFVSSFMVSETSELLPTGINPVTAIPTYVMPGESLVIEGHTIKGAHMPLTPEAYGSLTHDFISEMGFNVKEIMPYVVLQSPMPRLEHIAFIDMPGYNPAYSESADTAADEGIASAALTEADAVIWLLGLDSNGTLSSDDISFLLEHADGSKPLYIVVNKADLRPLNAIMEIVEEIKKNLDRSGIGYEGISAYSATLGRELFHHGNSLKEVMTLWDHHSSAAAAVHKEFESLMNGLEEASRLMKKNTENVLELLHSLRLDFVELSAHKGGASTETWLTRGLFGRTADRTERLHEDAVDKFARLQRAVTGVTVRDEVSAVLKNLREHGHELLRKVCAT